MYVYECARVSLHATVTFLRDYVLRSRKEFTRCVLTDWKSYAQAHAQRTKLFCKPATMKMFSSQH